MTEREVAVPEAVDTVQQRLAVLESLTDGPVQPQALVDRLGTSRSTVTRAVRDLEALDLAERVDGGYRATLVGRLAAERVRDHFDAMRDIAGATAALAPLDPDAAVAPAFLAGADVHVAADPAPYRVTEPITDALADATGFRSLNASIPEPDFIHQVHERTLAGELDGEAVVSPAMHEVLEADFADTMAALTATGNHRVLVADDLSYGLLLAEEGAGRSVSRAFLVVPDERGAAHAVVGNDTPAALAWAERRYRTVRERATDVTASLRADGSADDEDDG